MRTFSARETAWLRELDGIELAGFRRRAVAFLFDWFLVILLISITATLGVLLYVALARVAGHPVRDVNLISKRGNIHISDKDLPAEKKGFHYHIGLPAETAASDPHASRAEEVLGEVLHVVVDILVPCLYFGLFLWRWNGQTPGKRLMKIRVVSLVHRHMTFWHSVERALGYGAAALEAGFGFIQFWIHPYRRCAQDRLAETIVVTERSWRSHRDAETVGAESPL